MRKVVSAGGIILDGPNILLVQQEGGFGFPKGGVEQGETEAEAAVREVLEETGRKVKIVGPLGNRMSRRSVYYPDGYHPDAVGEEVTKDVVLFLMQLDGEPDRLPGPYDVPVWVKVAEAAHGMRHSEDADFILAYILPLLDVE